MTYNSQISFIMVGLGGISNTWLPIFNQFKNKIDLVAVCDPNKNSFEKLEDYGYENVLKFSNLEQTFIAGIEADAVIILTPPQYHYDNIKKSIMNNCNIICEKPVITTIEQFNSLKNLIKIAKKKNLVCAVNQQYRWMKRIEVIRKAIINKKFGNIGLCVSNFCQNRYHFEKWWRQQLKDISQFNWFIHHYDSMRYILDKNPVSVRAKLIKLPWSKISGESSIFLNVKFEDGIEWSYTATQEGVGNYEDSNQSTFTIYGEKGCIRNTKNNPPQLWLEKEDIHTPEIINLCEQKQEDKIQTDTSSKTNTENKEKYPSVEKTMEYFINSVNSKNSFLHPTRFEDNLYTIAIPLCARESHLRGGIEINIEEYLGLKTQIKKEKMDEIEKELSVKIHEPLHIVKKY
ncbi:MAG: Gfo/Idh/MocA family oxidoreductase [archaeon]|nr:Gfo/Idh/MocA family oxidoreductase [archaeon]